MTGSEAAHLQKHAACTINVLKRRRQLSNPQLVFHTVVNSPITELRDIVTCSCSGFTASILIA